MFVQTYLLLRKARLPVVRNDLALVILDRDASAVAEAIRQSGVLGNSVAASSNGNYLLHPANNPALCLGVRNAGTTAGTVVIGRDCNGHQ